MAKHLRFNHKEFSRKAYFIGTGAAIALGVGAAVAAIGSTAIAASASGKDKTPDAPSLPSIPGIQETADEQRRKANQARASQTDTILTGPLGVQEGADTKKTLLGA